MTTVSQTGQTGPFTAGKAGFRPTRSGAPARSSRVPKAVNQRHQAQRPRHLPHAQGSLTRTKRDVRVASVFLPARSHRINVHGAPPNSRGWGNDTIDRGRGRCALKSSRPFSLTCHLHVGLGHCPVGRALEWLGKSCRAECGAKTWIGCPASGSMHYPGQGTAQVE